MTSVRSCLLFFFAITVLPVFSQEKVILESRDGRIVYTFHLSEGIPYYNVSFKGRKLIEDSKLGFSFKGKGDFGTDLRMSKPLYSTVDETYELVVGKTSLVRDRHREVILPLQKRRGLKRKVNVRVRVFNDGVAFRYEFPTQEGWSSYELLDENSTWKITGDPLVRCLFWDHYDNDHEGLYHSTPLSQVATDTLMDLPALFEFTDHVYMAITEANLRDYAGMYLSRHDGILISKLSPLPGQTEIKVKATLPHRSPWRVMMIGDRIGTLMESNILTSLNEPTALQDLSWIHPGKTTFHWWNGDITPDTTFAPGDNFETNQYYIDFCARNHIDFHAVIGYGGFAWYKSHAENYGVVGPHTDVTVPAPTLDMQRVCDYAREKGVGIHLWVHWQALYNQLEAAFTQYEAWGVKGLMVDFMNRDDQEMVRIQEEILQRAADHHLYIQFHGAYKPTGLHRTYPNEFTREGTYNYEQNKWSDRGVTPEHDLNIVFTRLLAGATDYHLGGFRAVPESRFKPQYTRPLMIGTRCHMLAMYVILESYLVSLCDYPQAYEGQPGFEFLTGIPTTWDETRVLDASVGEFVTMARRRGTSWYVGSINNHEPRTLEIPLDFLDDGEYTATIYRDASDVEIHPNHINLETLTVRKTDVINLQLAAGGGQVMQLTRY